MDFVKSLATKVVASATSGITFPYTIGEREEGQDWTSIWSLHRGIRKEDGMIVSIFVFEVAKAKDKLVFARNALKRFRTIRHPSIVHYIDSIETDSTLYLITEPVVPLATSLKDPDQNLLTWGLYKIVTVLKFMNMDSSLVHGNVRISSIYTTKSGEWKLGGLEQAGPAQEDSSVISLYGGGLPDIVKYEPPEIRKNGWKQIRNSPPSALDSYMLGCLIHEVYNGPFSRPEQIGHTREKIPPSLFAIYRALLDQNPNSRLNPAGLLDIASKPGGFFDNQFISVANFLEQISIKDQAERDRFVSQLSGKIDTFPEEFAMHKILPELLKATEMGAGGAKMVGPLMRLGAKLSHEDFEKNLAPSLVKLYNIPDRQIRVALLENLDRYIDHFDASSGASSSAQKLLNEKIFPQIAQGFNDTSAVMREFTLKSLLTLIPRLSERTINNDLLRYLAKLQVDEEPGIRTNTTILLGKISKNLTESTQKKVLIPAFARSVKDPFPPARNAGLMALAATVDYHDPADIASKALPVVTPLMLDAEKSIRTQAFKTADVLIKRLERIASDMPEPDKPVSASGGQTTPTSVDAWAGWAGSAVAGLSKQLASTVIDKASNALIGDKMDSIPALTPTSANSTSSSPASNSFDERRPSQPTLQPVKTSSSGAMKLGSKLPTVTLPEVPGWGDWGAMDAELDERISEDNPFNSTSSLPKPIQPQKTNSLTKSSLSSLPAFEEIPSLAPPPNFKSPSMKATPISANGDFASFPPPKLETDLKIEKEKPASPKPMNLKKSTPQPSGEWDAWADNFLTSAKATTPTSDRDKKKAERDERLAALKAQRAAAKTGK